MCFLLLLCAFCLLSWSSPRCCSEVAWLRPQARPRAKCFGRRVWLIGGIALRVLLLWPCFSVGIALKVLGCLWPCSVRDSVLRGLAPRGLALLGRMVLALRGPWAAGSSSQRALALRGADSQGIVSEGCGSHGVWGWLRMGVLVSRGRALKIFVSGSRASGVLALKVLCFRGLALGARLSGTRSHGGLVLSCLGPRVLGLWSSQV